jgi:TolB-like protein
VLKEASAKEVRHSRERQLVDHPDRHAALGRDLQSGLQASTIFAAQDDIAARIVATVADSYGILVRSMRAAMGRRTTPN